MPYSVAKVLLQLSHTHSYSRKKNKSKIYDMKYWWSTIILVTINEVHCFRLAAIIVYCCITDWNHFSTPPTKFSCKTCLLLSYWVQLFSCQMCNPLSYRNFFHLASQSQIFFILFPHAIIDVNSLNNDEKTTGYKNKWTEKCWLWSLNWQIFYWCCHLTFFDYHCYSLYWHYWGCESTLRWI